MDMQIGSGGEGTGQSGSGSGDIGKQPDDRSAKLWIVYCIAAAVILLLYVVFVVIVLLRRFRTSKKNGKYSLRNCELDNVVDNTIIELFHVLDKRNGVVKPSTIASRAKVETSESCTHQPAVILDSVVLKNSQPSSPSESIPSNRSGSIFSTQVETLQLKPLAGTPLYTADNETIYDKLDKGDLGTTTEGDTMIRLGVLQECTYDDATSSPQHLTLKSECECNKNLQSTHTGARSMHSPSSGDSDHYTAVLDDDLYTKPGSNLSDHTYTNIHDPEGVYTLPDSPPQKKDSQPYSYASQHVLVVSPSRKGVSNEGEIRQMSERSQSSPAKHISSIYTNIDDFQSNRSSCSYVDIDEIGPGNVEPSYSKIDEKKEKYSYASTHMLVSPTRTSERGEVISKPEEFDDCHPNAPRGKSHSLPGLYRLPLGNHTYANLPPSQLMTLPTSYRATTTETIQEVPNEATNPSVHPELEEDDSSNPLYVSSDHLKKRATDTENPLYAASDNVKEEEVIDKSKDSDYLSSCKDWLPEGRLSLTDPEVNVLITDQTDHTYMGILVRDRVDNDYSMPKPSARRLRSYSSDPHEQEELPIQRTFSLDEKCHKYENQAMWLKRHPQRKPPPLQRVPSASYMQLLQSGFAYEGFYSRPSQFSNSQQ